MMPVLKRLQGDFIWEVRKLENDMHLLENDFEL